MPVEVHASDWSEDRLNLAEALRSAFEDAAASFRVSLGTPHPGADALIADHYGFRVEEPVAGPVFVGDEVALELSLAQGIDAHLTGLPVAPAIIARPTRDEARASLRLMEGRPCSLFLGTEPPAASPDGWQVLAHDGGLTTHAPHAAQLLAACDVAVLPPSPSLIAITLAAGVPMILRMEDDPESADQALAAVELQTALAAGDEAELRIKLDRLRRDGDLLRHLRHAARQNARPAACLDMREILERRRRA